MDLLENYEGDELDHWYFKHKYRVIKKILYPDLMSGTQVYDIGAGSGVFSIKLQEDFPHLFLTLIDINYDLSDLAKSNEKKVLLNAIPKQLCEVVIITDVLEHIEDDLAFLKKCSDSSVPGTRFLITVPAWQILWSGHDIYLKHFRRYRKNGLITCVSNSNLKIIEVKYIYFFHFPLIMFYRKFLKRNQQVSHLKPVGKFLNLFNYSLTSVDLLVGKFAPFGSSLVLIAEKV